MKNSLKSRLKLAWITAGVLFLFSLYATLLDFYAPCEFTYIAYVTSPNEVGENWIFLMDGYEMLDYASFDGTHITTMYDFRHFLEPSHRELFDIVCQTEYFKVFKVESNYSLKYLFEKKARLISEVAEELPDGLYFVEKYVSLVSRKNPEFKVTQKPFLLSRAILEKNGSRELFTYFDYSQLVKVPKYIVKMRARAMPPWYVAVKLYSLYMYPISAILLLCLAKTRKMKYLTLTALLVSFPFFIASVHARDYSLYYAYAKAFTPQPLKLLIPPPPLSPHFLPELKQGDFTVPLGVVVTIEVPCNTTKPLMKLINSTALKHIQVFAKIVKASKIAILPSSSRLKLTFKNCTYEKTRMCYIVDLSDLEKVIVTVTPQYAYFESVTGGSVKIALQKEGETSLEITGFLQVGVPVKVNYIIGGG